MDVSTGQNDASKEPCDLENIPGGCTKSQCSLYYRLEATNTAVSGQPDNFNQKRRKKELNDEREDYLNKTKHDLPQDNKEDNRPFPKVERVVFNPCDEEIKSDTLARLCRKRPHSEMYEKTRPVEVPCHEKVSRLDIKPEVVRCGFDTQSKPSAMLRTGCVDNFDQKPRKEVFDDELEEHLNRTRHDLPHDDREYNHSSLEGKPLIFNPCDEDSNQKPTKEELDDALEDYLNKTRHDLPQDNTEDSHSCPKVEPVVFNPWDEDNFNQKPRKEELDDEIEEYLNKTQHDLPQDNKDGNRSGPKVEPVVFDPGDEENSNHKPRKKELDDEIEDYLNKTRHDLLQDSKEDNRSGPKIKHVVFNPGDEDNSNHKPKKEELDDEIEDYLNKTRHDLPQDDKEYNRSCPEGKPLIFNPGNEDSPGNFDRPLSPRNRLHASEVTASPSRHRPETNRLNSPSHTRSRSPATLSSKLAIVQAVQDIVVRSDDMALVQAKQDIIVRSDEMARAEQDIVVISDEMAQAEQDIVVKRDEMAQAERDIVVKRDEMAQAEQDIVVISDDEFGWDEDAQIILAVQRSLEEAGTSQSNVLWLDSCSDIDDDAIEITPSTQAAAPRSLRCSVLECEIQFSCAARLAEHRASLKHSPCDPTLLLIDGRLPDPQPGTMCPYCVEVFTEEAGCLSHKCPKLGDFPYSGIGIGGFMCPQCLMILQDVPSFESHIATSKHNYYSMPFPEDFLSPRLMPAPVSPGFARHFAALCRSLDSSLYCADCSSEVTADHTDSHRRHIVSASARFDLLDVFMEYLCSYQCKRCWTIFATNEASVGDIHMCGRGEEGVVSDANVRSFSELLRVLGLRFSRDSVRETLRKPTCPTSEVTPAASPQAATITQMEHSCKPSTSNSKKCHREALPSEKHPPKQKDVATNRHPRRQNNHNLGKPPARRVSYPQNRDLFNRRMYEQRFFGGHGYFDDPERIIETIHDRRLAAQVAPPSNALLSTMKLVIFLDLNSWPTFFKRLPRCLPDLTFVWAFHHMKTVWLEPVGFHAYTEQKLKGFFHLSKKNGLTKAAANWSFVLQVGAMNAMLPTTVPFTILPGKKSLHSLEQELPSPERRLVVIDPSPAETCAQSADLFYTQITSVFQT